MASKRPINALAFAAALLCLQAQGQAQTPGEGVPSYAPSLLDRLPSVLEGYAPAGSQGQLQMQYLAFVGREDLIMRFEPDAFVYRDCPVLAGAGDPIAQIREAARTARIVIVNEAHDQPLHRAFIEDLALALAQDGFEVFAAETFNENGLAAAPPEASGFYSREPIFTRQLRALDSAGYRFAAYEMTQAQRLPDAATVSERIAAREEAQANNFVANVLAGDPDARILVHVGYSHLFEAPFTQGEGEAAEERRWFAARLKDKTGIDPLTISQTHCSSAIEGVALADGTGAAPEGTVDMFLARGDIELIDQRPAWRRARGDRAIAAPSGLRQADRAVILEARRPHDGLGVLPVERLLLFPGEALPLLLPAGRWRIDAFTREGLFASAELVAD